MSEEKGLHLDRTVLASSDNGSLPDGAPLTDKADAVRVEELDGRLVFSARARPSHSFTLSLNTLVAAASDVLSEVIRIKQSRVGEDLTLLNERLTRHITNFEHRAGQLGVESRQVMMARYVLCTVADEAVVTTSWGVDSDWSQKSLLSTFHSETFGGEKFFLLLETLLKSAAKQLQMLELMYLCLALGFEGRYRVADRGMQGLDSIRDDLYQRIRQLRGDVPRELSPQWQGLGNQRRNLVRIVPTWMVALFTLVSLGVMYSGFAWVLGEQRERALQPYLPTDPTTVQLPQPYRDMP
uniref:type IVB secretion system protein IcmH/DotU n=1 Tax=Pseudomonas laurentiana TaxID=2364649 RepID=UPI0029C88D36|nr:type IVB secretion system protein IcmH/DotU [Pseudomonas laurentiana]